MSSSREMFTAAIADFPEHVQAAAIEAYDRRRYQERLMEAVTLYGDLCEGCTKDSSDDTQAPGYGGTEAESDCPKERGSRRRPEGLTAGARWLRRLP